jgi:chemotaxis protein MotB
LVVSLREVGFFDSGSALIKPAAEDAFGRVTRVLQEHSCAVRIEGHTDTIPIHNTSFASNWELSTARATQVVKVLIEKYKFPPERLSAAGYAEFHPIAANDAPEKRQLNRRVDVVIVAATIRAVPLPKTDGPAVLAQP